MTKKSQNQEATIRTRRIIINLLKQEGAMDSQALAKHLEISPMAVRQHLYGLQEEQLVTYSEEPRPMGRPAKLWQLTGAANRFFPNGYADLTLSLINSVTEVFGEDGLERLIEVRTRQQIATYMAPISKNQSLGEKLETLAKLRTDEGYMALVQQQGEGKFLLIENHCPICAAATACTGICTQELEVFRSVLGENVLIERTEHIINGARRCTYNILSS
jgi:predicted ArsR family transcriptional regulator